MQLRTFLIAVFKLHGEQYLHGNKWFASIFIWGFHLEHCRKKEPTNTNTGFSDCKAVLDLILPPVTTSLLLWGLQVSKKSIVSCSEHYLCPGIWMDAAVVRIKSCNSIVYYFYGLFVIENVLPQSSVPFSIVHNGCIFLQSFALQNPTNVFSIPTLLGLNIYYNFHLLFLCAFAEFLNCKIGIY